MDLTAALINSTGMNGPEHIMEATRQLEQLASSNMPMYLASLVTALSDENKPDAVRQQAGLQLKNQLTSRDEEKKKRMASQWIAMDANTRNTIKQQVISTFESSHKLARQTAAQVCSQIAVIELKHPGMWDDLIPNLLHFIQNPRNEFQKESILTCLGYICEESEHSTLQEHSNGILTAVAQTMRKEEPNLEVRYQATVALSNSLEFIKGNMDNERERNYLMSILCEATQPGTTPEARIREAAMECLCRIATLYYDKLRPYMQALFQVTFDAVRKDELRVGLQGIEFWSSLCDMEMELLTEDPNNSSCENYVKGALKHLVDLLCECLVKQSDDQEEDEWNLATAAGTCLCLCAQTTHNEIVQHVMPFIANNINNQDWKYREAATLAFGSILDGPEEHVIVPLVDQAVPCMLEHMSDERLLVKDTTTWTIGRIAECHPEPIITKYFQPVLEAFGRALADQPRIAAKACWGIQNICNYWDDDDQSNATYPLSGGFRVLVEALIKTIDRKDANESNLRSSAYEALNALLASAADDCMELVTQLIPVVIQRLEQTFGIGVSNASEKQEVSTVQGLLCGALQVIARKLKEGIKPYADKMMEIFLKVFETNSTTVHEESLLAVGAVANAVGPDFEKYVAHFAQFLYLGLKQHQEYQVCNIAVGVVGDIALALGHKLAPYCDEIMTILLENLRNIDLNRDVKPTIIACFGDIALNIGALFEKYLSVVMTVMEQASKVTLSEEDAQDEDMIEYLNTLRENICEAYTGIMQGFAQTERKDAFLPYVPQVLEFVQTLSRDQNLNASAFRAVVGVIGDLANVFGAKIAPALQNECIQSIVMKAVQTTEDENDAIHQAGEWTMNQLRKVSEGARPE
eukprot:TRINITY_DN67786_c6_g2_i2.p1 TRINITY_DN67786_c6_g2~~TRINITY_DN67786_c6_g2_i2.p1  ORF type:complete len:864 (-),score=149.23 TRINITY_DN67786_c6_g2_i2:103-2694(-)